MGTLRSILVALDGSEQTTPAIDLAFQWSVQFSARVVGVGVIDEPTIMQAEPVPLGAFAYKGARDEVRLKNARARVRRFLSDFEVRANAGQIPATTITTTGSPPDRILRETQRCDVLMIGRDANFHFETQDYPDRTLAVILRNGARPVVVVPPRQWEGQGVMVAYGGGREVARAIQSFQLLGLAESETVHLVSVQREGWEAEALAGLAADFLTAHNTAHEEHAVVSRESPADALLEQVDLLRPRLLVMGTQGYHPVRDLFVSSVTRLVLQKSPVPVFVAA